VSGIEAIGVVEPRDRIGVRWREEGFVEPADFVEGTSYLADIELWDLGRREVRERKLGQIISFWTRAAAKSWTNMLDPLSRCCGSRLPGELLQTLLTVEDIASIDQPPQPDVATGAAINLVLDQVPPLNAVSRRCSGHRNNRQRA